METWADPRAEAFYRNVAERATALLGVPFTARQAKIAYLLQCGYDDERVAREIGVGRRTVQREVAAIAARLRVRSRFETAFELGRLWERLQRERPLASPYSLLRRFSE